MLDIFLGAAVGGLVAFTILGGKRRGREAAVRDESAPDGRRRRPQGELLKLKISRGEIAVGDILAAAAPHVLADPGRYAIRLATFDAKGRRTGTSAPGMGVMMSPRQRLFIRQLHGAD